MSCGTKGAKGGRKTLLYIEAVRKYIEVFQELDLTGPYARVIYKIMLSMIEGFA